MSTYILMDMDDTLDMGGRVNERVAQFLVAEHEAGKTVAIVSGRQRTKMQETRDWLEQHGLMQYVAEIHLSDFPAGPNASREFKLYKARLIQEAGHRIAIAVENDEATREGYRQLGIDAIAPSRVPEVDGGWVDPETESDDEEDTDAR